MYSTRPKKCKLDTLSNQVKFKSPPSARSFLSNALLPGTKKMVKCPGCAGGGGGGGVGEGVAQGSN